ncbi:hypothetical protein [Lactobacillus phage Lbab1]|nr:hypothetical protein [Lactobacillus phage Lbab1]
MMEKYVIIKIEDLKAKNLLNNHKLSRSIAWAGTALSKIAVTSILSNILEVQVCSVPRSSLRK